MSVQVPGKLKDVVTGPALEAIVDALSPPSAERLEASFEIEIEAPGEGTFTLRYEDGVLEGEKGMADEPFASAAVPKGGWPLVQRVLQAAVDGFPASADLQQRQARVKGLKRKDANAAFQGLSKLKDALFEVVVPEIGTYRLARGSLEEATRTLRVEIPQGAVDAAFDGDLGPLSRSKVGGDKRLQADLLAALGQAWLLIKG